MNVIQPRAIVLLGTALGVGCCCEQDSLVRWRINRLQAMWFFTGYLCSVEESSCLGRCAQQEKDWKRSMTVGRWIVTVVRLAKGGEFGHENWLRRHVSTQQIWCLVAGIGGGVFRTDVDMETSTTGVVHMLHSHDGVLRGSGVIGSSNSNKALPGFSEPKYGLPQRRCLLDAAL